MKKPLRKMTDEEMLAAFPIRGETLGWFFRIREISNNGWEVEGSDRWGRRVSRIGGDTDRLLAECEADAAQINQDLEAEGLA